MGTKFSEDVVPLTDLKVNPGRVVRHVAQARRPVLLTSRGGGGGGVAVVQSIIYYEMAEEERAFMRAVVAGLADLEAGREVSLAGGASPMWATGSLREFLLSSKRCATIRDGSDRAAVRTAVPALADSPISSHCLPRRSEAPANRARLAQ